MNRSSISSQKSKKKEPGTLFSYYIRDLGHEMISQILLDFFVLFFHILFFYFCFSIFLEELQVDQSGGRSDIYISAI